MSEGHGEHLHKPPTNFWKKYIFSMDHKMIGKQYLFTALFFLVLGGMMAMMIRWQLAYPGKPVPVVGSLLSAFREAPFVNADGSVSPEGYIKLVTMHGTIMVFFVIIPILVGAFGNFLIPLHIGARDVSFPLLNALSYWFYLPAGIIIFVSLIVDPGGAAAGWTSYSPLAQMTDTSAGPRLGQILWLISLFFIGWSSILGGINFLTTIIKLRAPGMTWGRLPLVTWAQFVTAIFQTLATPVLAAALMMQLIDLTLGTSFFLPLEIFIGNKHEMLGRSGGGHPLLWQHVFWFYSHPAVYILVLPGMGIASDLLATFARKTIFGYKAMVISMASIMGLGFVVWGHHMFVSSMSNDMTRFFMTTTMLIAVPSGVKVFNWLATMWGGSMRFTTPMLCAISFVAMFIIGGLSGLFMAAPPVDIPIHDTYYVVAHFHYVVFGGTLFAVFGGLYYWFPKMFGRMMNETLGKVHWFLTFVAFNLAFFPMHMLGEAGAMRRVFTHSEYAFLQPIQPMNVFISHAAFLLGAVQVIFVFNLFWSMWKGKKAESNPWQSNTLEWTIPSPAPYHNYDRIPTVYRGPYEYSSGEPNGRGDWAPQDEPPKGAASHH